MKSIKKRKHNSGIKSIRKLLQWEKLYVNIEKNKKVINHKMILLRVFLEKIEIINKKIFCHNVVVYLTVIMILIKVLIWFHIQITIWKIVNLIYKTIIFKNVDNC